MKKLLPNPEYDKAGYCSKCHTAIAEFDGANNIKRLLGKSSTFQVRLDDKSLMTVQICDKCKINLKPEDTTHIMESVIKGWEFDCDSLILKGAVRVDGRKWDEKLKEEHMDRYSKRYIMERTDKFWPTEMIVDAVYAEEIKSGNEKARKEGKTWQS